MCTTMLATQKSTSPSSESKCASFSNDFFHIHHFDKLYFDKDIRDSGVQNNKQLLLNFVLQNLLDMHYRKQLFNGCSTDFVAPSWPQCVPTGSQVALHID